jgi:hypothetical protein
VKRKYYSGSTRINLKILKGLILGIVGGDGEVGKGVSNCAYRLRSR